MDSTSVSASSARARSRGFGGEQEVRRFERCELGTISLTKDKSLLSASPIWLANYCRSFLYNYYCQKSTGKNGGRRVSSKRGRRRRRNRT